MINPQEDEKIKDLVKETLVYRWEKEKYRYFEPIGKVESFINNVGSGKYLISLISAANGVGKTLAGVNIIAHLIWPCGNQYFQSPLFKNWPYPKRIRIVSDPTVIVDNIIPTMKAQFPKGRFGATKYTTTKEGKRFESKWETDNGWEISLMTYEQDPREFEGATLGLVWCDEPPPLGIYKALIARLRMGGTLFMTETPLTGSAWIYDLIVTNPNNKTGFRSFIEAEVEDACIDHGVRGFLEHAQIEKLIAQYDKEDLQARVFGKFQHLTGLIFKNFNPNIHVIDPFDVTMADFMVTEAFDWHPRVPDALSWVARDRRGIYYIIDELYGNYELSELAQRIRNKSANYRIERRIIDLSAFNEDKHEKAVKNSFAKKLSNDYNLYYSAASKLRHEAIKLTRRQLDYSEVGGMVTKPPMLYVFSTCERHIYEFTHWQWEDWRGSTREYKDPREKPMDKDDHMMENIGRVIIEDLPFQEAPVIQITQGALGTGPSGRDITNADPYA